MFERFTDRARRVIVLAQENAMLLKHSAIGTEHLLLGLSQENEGVAAKVLDDLGLHFKYISERVEPGDTPAHGHLPFTQESKRALELSLREALQLGHNYIGTEHILLGLIRADSPLSNAIIESKIDLATARIMVIRKLASYSP